MKKINTLLFLLIFSILFSQNSIATMEITYENKIVRDSLNKDQIMYFNYTLLCNEKESIYFNRDTKNFYEEVNKPGKYSINNIVELPKYPKVRGSVYKNADDVIAFLPISRQIYRFEEPILKWEILQEKKVIKGFNSQLAKTKTDTGDVFYAWFTQDIPIQDGPFRFRGLPGMILEVYNKNRTIEIYATETKKSSENISLIEYGNDQINVKSKEIFLNTRKNYYANPEAFNFNNIKVYDMNGNDLSKNVIKNIQKNNIFLD